MTDDFTEAVASFLVPVLAPMGFDFEIQVSGRLYSAEFISPRHVVSVSFEPGDDYWLVLVHTVRNGVRSDIDDRAATPRLSDLNARFLTKGDGDKLRALKQDQTGENPLRGRIKRIAAELAVVLPRYLATA